MNELAQLPSQRRSPVPRSGLGRHLRALTHLRALIHLRALTHLRGLRLGRPSCMTLYAMQLASGVPVEREPGVCPVCGSSTCGLARSLEHRR